MRQYSYRLTRGCIIALLCILMLMNYFCQSPKPLPSILQYVIHSQNNGIIELQYADSLALFISREKALETFKLLEKEHRDNPKVHRYISFRINSLRAQLEIPDSTVQNKIFTTDPTNIFEVIADYDVHYNLKPNTILIEPLKELVAQKPGFYPTALALNRIGLFYKNVCFDLDSSWHYFGAARDTLEKIGLITLEHIICYENLLTLSVYKRKNLDAIMYGNELCDFERYSWKPDSVEMARGFINRAFVLFREGDNTGSKLDDSLAMALIDSSKNIKEYQRILSNEIMFSYNFDTENNFIKSKLALIRSIKESNHDYVNIDRLISNYYEVHSRYKDAIPYLFRALNYELNQLHHNSFAYSNICSMFSTCYTKLKQFDNALIFIAKNKYLNSINNEQAIYTYLKTNIKSQYSFITAIKCSHLYFEKFIKTNQIADLKIANKYIEVVNETMYGQLKIADENAILQFYLETGNFFFKLAMKVNHTLFKLTADNLFIDRFISFSEKSKYSLMNRDIRLYNQWTNLSNNLIDKEKKLRSERQREIIKGYRNNLEFNILQNKYNLVYKEIDAINVNYSSNKLLSTTESLSEIIAKIDTNTSILNTAHFDNQIYMVLINKNSVNLFKSDSDSLEITVLNALDSAINTGFKADTSHINQLYSLVKRSLFSLDLEKQLRENIIIIPDGLFHRLPLQLLYKNNHNIIYSPSIRTINPSNSYSKSGGKLAAFSFSGKKTIFASKRSYLNELPGSMKEVNKLKSSYKNPQIYCGHAATKDNFFKAYTDTTIDYIHLAIHGFSNSTMKDDVKLYFRTSNGGIDSLYGFELLGLKSKVNKIVLSACQSTMGKYAEGEGNYSLIRYFLINGAKEVQASNYNLMDNNFVNYNHYIYKIL